MRSRILVICGHPRKDSLCSALARAYVDGARGAGADVRLLELADLEFDLHVRHPSPNQQPRETAIADAQHSIRCADHVVFVYPNWWGTMPALLKGFLDRVLTPGFAFTEDEEIPGRYAPCLEGRSAELLVTMDTPPWVFRAIYRAPGNNAMRRATLGFCGLRTLKTHLFGAVKPASAATRAKWVAQAREAGAGVLELLKRGERRSRITAWVKLMRLQFYPMTFLAYSIGALAGARGIERIDAGTYWLGYLFVFLIEVITVFGNEYFDFGTDRLNRNAGPFNGGSRVLVKGELSIAAVRNALLALTLLMLPLAYLVVTGGAALTSTHVALMGLAILLAVGYTVPPLKLVYRGLGEINVGLTHSVVVIMAGYVLQTGTLMNPYPWLLSIPLFLSILPAITLSAIPDYEADRAVGKRTAAVALGPQNAVRVAMGCTLGAAAIGVLWHWLGMLPGPGGWLIYLALPHAWALTRCLQTYYDEGAPSRPIDGLMFLALNYLMWFAVVPLIVLW